MAIDRRRRTRQVAGRGSTRNPRTAGFQIINNDSGGITISFPSDGHIAYWGGNGEVTKIDVGERILLPLRKLTGEQLLLENTTDQELLARTIMDSKDSDERDIAIHRLNDQRLLGVVAETSKEAYFRKIAVEKLNDQAVLAKIATDDQDWVVRMHAVYKITDPSTLERLANQAADPNVRLSAQNRLAALRRPKN